MSRVGVILFCTLLHAQSIERSVVGSAGTSNDTAGYSISYTVGEPVVSTLISPSNYLTQGFQQPTPSKRLRDTLFQPESPRLSDTPISPVGDRLTQTPYPSAKDSLDQTTRHPILRESSDGRNWYLSFSSRQMSSLGRFSGKIRLVLLNAKNQVLVKKSIDVDYPSFLDLGLPTKNLAAGTYYLKASGSDRYEKPIQFIYIFRVFKL